ncbi:MAG: (2Fe-2S)-binding protein [Microthrixaceae bacterium]|nr:(2Fe-2S)-binding protein [Microthrixaceae bacterium]MCO5313555.1 (2Fe-2S)-binding protein [Microthrixaceae bacterium]
MLVCSCNAVFEGAVRKAVSGGAACVDEVSTMCGAGTDCGSCIDHIEEIIDEVNTEVRVSIQAA